LDLGPPWVRPGLALSELAQIYSIEQASRLREAAILRSAWLRVAGERAEARATARWFAAWQPTTRRSLAGWAERVRLFQRSAELDGWPIASVLERCARVDLSSWPAVSRLAREAHDLDPCPWGRLVVARARFADGRTAAARRELQRLCAPPKSEDEAPRAVRSEAWLTLSAMEELAARPSVERSYRCARKAFLLSPSAKTAWRLFDLALRSNRTSSALRAAELLARRVRNAARCPGDALDPGGPQRALKAYARWRRLLPGSQRSARSAWIELVTRGEKHLLDLGLQLISSAE
ncbi:MAG: hypothetical protein AAF368_16520, partial [Planctomycetota bacterium]